MITTLYNRYNRSFGVRRRVCDEPFKNPDLYRTQMRSFLTVNFPIVGE